MYFLSIDDDHEVASIHMGRKDRAMLSHQQSGNFGCHSADDLIFGIEEPPIALDLPRFCHKGFHQITLPACTFVGSVIASASDYPSPSINENPPK